jgi:hypothetical protein
LQGSICSLGVFPVSIKNEDFLRIARDEKTIQEAVEIRKKVSINVRINVAAVIGECA